VQFFNNLEEVKKVIHAEADEAIHSWKLKNMGFDCINPYSFKSDECGHKRETTNL
jgi:hypothetical protein